MTYEEYADQMNAHADGCEQCAFARDTGLTDGACEVAKGIITEWKASKHSEEDLKWATLNMVARMMELSPEDFEDLADEDEPIN
jgi:hypothetical protein